jgi:enoyl-CoA hydratase/carnithine racemase
MIDKPNNNEEAFELALSLAISAPTQEQSDRALNRAREIAGNLTPETVEAIKRKLETP